MAAAGCSCPGRGMSPPSRHRLSGGSSAGGSRRRRGRVLPVHRLPRCRFPLALLPRAPRRRRRHGPLDRPGRRWRGNRGRARRSRTGMGVGGGHAAAAARPGRSWAHVHERLGPSGWNRRRPTAMSARIARRRRLSRHRGPPLPRGWCDPSWVAGHRPSICPCCTRGGSTRTRRGRSRASRARSRRRRIRQGSERPRSQSSSMVVRHRDRLRPARTAGRPTRRMERPRAGDAGGHRPSGLLDRRPGTPVLGPPRYASRWISDVESTAWGRSSITIPGTGRSRRWEPRPGSTGRTGSRMPRAGASDRPTWRPRCCAISRPPSCSRSG